MFKNMIVYRIAPGWQADLVQVEEALAKAPFMECGATQEKSLGWVPPRGEQHGARGAARLPVAQVEVVHGEVVVEALHLLQQQPLQVERLLHHLRKVVVVVEP